MTEPGGASGTAEHDQPPAAMPGGQAADGQLAPAEIAQRALARHPWLAEAALLARLGLLAGAGATAQLLAGPSPAGAITAFGAVAAVLLVQSYREVSPRTRPRARPDGAWQFGDQPPDGVPAATIEAAVFIFAQLPRPWQGAWLQVTRCTDPVRHGRCRKASAAPAGGGMIQEMLGEHIAARPSDAAFVIAHEVRHPAGWTKHLSLAAFAARQAAWLAAGWAVPWPWLIPALAAIQIGYAAACWVTEAGCDIGGARVVGRGAALGFFAHRQALDRQPRPGPAWARRARRALTCVAVPAAHPPWRLRAAITRALVPAHAT